IAADHMTLLAESLVVHGFSVLNLEFRRGAALSSWAESVIDVRDGIAELGRLPDGFKVDPARVAVIGHSSGAHLAHCAVTLGQETLQAEEVQVLGLVSLAGILDLEAAQMQSLGSDSVRQYMGHSEPPADPRSCSPICQMLPSDILLVHGNSDGVVPISMSQRYLQCGAVRAAEIDFLPVDGADHMDLIKPDQSHWSVVLRWLRHRLMNLASSG
ncbi:MAG: prolyl oligopeptidase family serine peptidase, partial [Nitratireductor sp.]